MYASENADSHSGLEMGCALGGMSAWGIVSRGYPVQRGKRNAPLQTINNLNFKTVTLELVIPFVRFFMFYWLWKAKDDVLKCWKLKKKCVNSLIISFFHHCKVVLRSDLYQFYQKSRSGLPNVQCRLSLEYRQHVLTSVKRYPGLC